MPFSSLFGRFVDCNPTPPEGPYPTETDGGIIRKMRKQNAVYWPPATLDNYGKPTAGDPVVIRCRWESRVEKFINGKGEEQISQSVVYVDRELSIGGRLWLSPLIGRQTIESVLASGVPVDPVTNDDAYEIKRVDKLPDLRSKHFLKWITL